MAKNTAIRILVAEDDINTSQLFNRVLSPEDPKESFSELEKMSARLFGESNSQTSVNVPTDLFVCHQANKAVEEVKKSIDENRPYAVAFLDVRMPPGPSGIWAARQIRMADPDIEIVIVTGYSDIRTEEIAHKVQPPHKLLYLQKPLHPEEIAHFAHSLSSKWLMEKNSHNINKKLENEVDKRILELRRVNEALSKHTEQRIKIENAFMESEKRYRNLFKNSPDLIQEISPKGSFIFVNPAWHTRMGYSKEELSDLNFFDIIDPGVRSQFEVVFAEVLRGEMVINAEVVFITKGNKTLVAEGNLVPQMTKESRSVIYTFFRDITDRKEAEKAKQNAEHELEKQRVLSIHSDRLRSLGEMAAGIAHELNQPLSGILSISEHMLIGLDRKWEFSNEEIRENLDLIVQQVNRMNHIIEHVRNFSRETGKPDLHEIKINDAVESSLSILGRQMKSRGIEIRKSIQTSLPPVLANPFSLEAVLINLILNARDGIEEKLLNEPMASPCIHINAFMKDDCSNERITVEIIDTGTGISPEILSKVFDPFFTTKHFNKGTGLGLSICKTLIEKINGSIEIHSIKNRTTTVTISLPIKAKTGK